MHRLAKHVTVTEIHISNCTLKHSHSIKTMHQQHV